MKVGGDDVILVQCPFNFLPALHPGNQLGCLKENCVMQYTHETWGNHVGLACACYDWLHRFHKAYAWGEFSRKQLCWFPWYEGKKSFWKFFFTCSTFEYSRCLHFFALHYAREMIPVHLSCACYNWACGFHVAYALPEFSCKEVCRFLGCAGKSPRFLPVVSGFWISNICCYNYDDKLESYMIVPGLNIPTLGDSGKVFPVRQYTCCKKLTPLFGKLAQKILLKCLKHIHFIVN